MPKAGMLVQMDSSQHKWLEDVSEKWWLIAMIDDATNEVPYAYFFPKDTLFANMHVIRRFIELKGLFYALYADKASHFKTTRHSGIHYTTQKQMKPRLNVPSMNWILPLSLPILLRQREESKSSSVYSRIDSSKK